ncbi:MAG: glycosyltransferase [Deltaproteobacteria bacterium]|nr:glycosyltransferase [Deltaproteobacteria bacterium]
MAESRRLTQAGDLPGAIKVLRTAVEQGFTDASLLSDLAYKLAMTGNLREAEYSFRWAAWLAPRDPRILYNLGAVQAEMGSLEAAHETISRLLALEPSLPQARELLARLETEPGFVRQRQEIQARQKGKLARLRQMDRLSVKVLSPSDHAVDPSKRHLWGDYWVQYELEKQFASLGYTIAPDRNADLVICLLGASVWLDLPEDSLRLAWLYSHPDRMNPARLAMFDKIFSLSPYFVPRLTDMGFGNVEVMVGATDKRPLDEPLEYQVVFVGNPRGPQGRQVVTDLYQTGHQFKVWGNAWEQFLPPEFVGGEFWDYRELDKLYARTAISVNDHHPDMARDGFVAVKIFDILASGGFAISDRNRGIADIFGDTVPQYTDAADLKQLLDFFLEHPDERRKLAARGREIALTHTYRARAEQFARALAEPGADQRAPLPAEAARPAATEPLPPPVPAPAPHPAAEGRPQIFYLDLFRPDNSNFYWLAAWEARGQVHRLDLREDLHRLPEILAEVRPAHVHLGGSVKAGVVPVDFLAELKSRLGFTLSVFYGDAAYSPYHTELGRVADAVFISNQSHVDQNNLRHPGRYHYLPCPADPGVFHPVAGEARYDVVFIGNNNNPSRRELLGRLAARGNLVVAGEGWEGSGLQALPPVHGEDFARLVGASRILLGLMGEEWSGLAAYFSNRLVNTLACEGFLIQRYTPGLEQVFHNREHLVWYQSEEELGELIDHYLAHPEERQRIARQGRELVLSRYTYDRAVEAMLAATGHGDWPPAAAAAPPGPEVAPPSPPEAPAPAFTVPDFVPAAPTAAPAIPAPPPGQPLLKLHLGCGRNLLPGYVNIDKYNPAADLVQDVGTLPYAAGTVGEILTSHMIEHVTLAEFRSMLAEWLRVLAPGGLLAIRCPNHEVYLRRWLEGSEEYRWGEGLNCILGIQDRGPGYLNRNMFSPRRLAALLEEAGYEVLECRAGPTRSGHLPDADIHCSARKRP